MFHFEFGQISALYLLSTVVTTIEDGFSSFKKLFCVRLTLSGVKNCNHLVDESYHKILAIEDI